MNERLQRRRLGLRIRAVLLGAAPFLAVPGAWANTIMVDSAADAYPPVIDDGACSLREAIAAAEANTTVDSCAAGSSTSGDTIAFAGTLAGSTITVVNDLDLDAQQTVVTGDVDGDGIGDITLSGNHATRVLDIYAGATITLSQLTIADGNAPGAVEGSANGGGIYNAGALTLEHVHVRDSYAQGNGGGIFNKSGTLVASQSTVSGNVAQFDGGGIYNGFGASATLSQSVVSGNSAHLGGGISNYQGTLTLTLSTVSDSRAQLGGGIANQGTLTLTLSSVSDNSAPDGDGGGIYNKGELGVDQSSLRGNSARVGGGLANETIATLTRSDLTANSASVGGGGMFNNGVAEIRQCTISGNASPQGGGVANGVSATISQSTVSGNDATTGGGLYNFATMATSGSIIAGNSGGNCAGSGQAVNSSDNLFFPAAGGCVGGAVGDPRLGPLRDNGGPTWTMLPQAGSMAVDMTTCTDGVSTDQRGMPRRQALASTTGPWCDIGAVEVNFVDRDRIFRGGFD